MVGSNNKTATSFNGNHDWDYSRIQYREMREFNINLFMYVES